MFAQTTPSAGDAGPALEDQWQRPSPGLLKMRRLQTVGASAIATLLIALLISALTNPELGGGVILCGALLGGLAFFLMQRRVRSWAYQERGDDLIIQRGVMFRHLSVIPYGRMQFVDIAAGPFEQAFGLATVQLHTAAATTDARIPGLSHDEATRLRDQLATRAQAHTAGI